MVRVRFLRAKRFPHPDGPRRRPGEEHVVPRELASQWAAAGLVEPVTDHLEGDGSGEAPPELPAATPLPAKAKARTTRKGKRT